MATQVRRNSIFKISFIFAAGALGLLAEYSACAEVARELEVDYSEALLIYNEKNYTKTIKLLNELIVRADKTKLPGKVDFLELKALCQKALKDDTGALSTYGDIIRAKLALKHPRGELAAYYFDSGVISFQKEKDKEAKEYLEEAYRQGFNKEVSAFFLGNLAFKKGDWSEAENYFSVSADGRVDDLHPPSHFYLGKVGQKTNDSAQAYESFVLARDIARSQIQNQKLDQATRDSAKEIEKAANQALEPYNKGSFFANVSALVGYDTNVLSVPSSQSSGNEATGKDSVTTALSGSVGYMTSPTGFIQLVPSYKTSLTYNLNQETRLGDFFIHTGTLYFNRTPLAKTSYGLKLEATGTWQNQLNPDTNKSAFQPYSVAGGIGPYLKTRLERRISALLEFTYAPKREYGDKNATEDLKRSGTQMTPKLTLKYEDQKRFLNPGLVLTYDKTETKGRENRARSTTVELNNLFKLSDRWDLLGSTSLAFASYPERPSGKRNDTLWMTSASGIYKLKDKVNLLGNLIYYHNSSNLPDSYAYTRISFSAGASYTF